MQRNDSIRWTPVRLIIYRFLDTEGPMLGWDIHLGTGCHKNTVNRTVHDLHQAGVLYISGWGHPGSSNALGPIWAVKVTGEECDVRRPRKKPKATINRDWNMKNRAYKNAKQRATRGTTAGVWSGLL